jgi:hypothetical protein
MLNITSLQEVCRALPTALPDHPFRTQGKVVEVHYEQDCCHFTLADGDARLPCVLPRQAADSWIEVGQTLEVEVYAEKQRRLAVVAARPLNDRPFLHPANVAELAGIARDAGAEVLRGPLRYPSESGGWRLGDLDLSEYLSKYRDCEVTLIVAATGEAEKNRVFCGICGFALDDTGGECPRCRLIAEETARQPRPETDGEALFREVDEILADRDEG